MRSPRFIALAFALVHWFGPGLAHALDDDGGSVRRMLWYCNDKDLLHTQFPGCSSTLEALQVEIGGASLEVVALEAEVAAPADPVGLTIVHSAIFLAWVQPGLGGTSYLLYAYDALNDQILSKEVKLTEGADPPDAAAVAFLYRNMLGTSLFADLESIESDVDLWSLVFPQEKVEKVKVVEGLRVPEKPPREPLFHLDLSYLALGYSPDVNVWHNVSLGAHGRVHSLVELWLGAGASPAPLVVKDDLFDVKVKVWIVDIQTGARIRVVQKGPFTLLPGLGLGADLAVTDIEGAITGSGEQRRLSVLWSGFASILARIMFHRHVGLGVEFGAQVLFNTEDFCVNDSAGGCVDGPPMLDFGRLGLFARLGVVFGL